MTSVAFDTFAAANRFKRAGFTDDQIEALVEVTRETTSLPDISTLATKSDIERLEHATKSDIERLEHSTKSDVERLEHSIGRLDQSTKAEFARLEGKISAAQFQSVTVIIAATALIVTLGSVLPRLLH